MSHCRVRLLDESDIEIGVDLHANGRELLESVCKYLNIVEMDYFGLRYKGNNYDGIWIRPDKAIKKQFPIHPTTWDFIFAVQYYPTDPVYLKEEITKYQLCLQIRDDLMNGRLQCPLDTLITLSSYWLQSEFGDEEEQSSEVKHYLTSLKYISGAEKPTSEFEEKVEKLYKSRRGMPPGDADTQFLRLASSLPYYGLHRYETEIKDGVPLTVGIGSAGVFELKDKEKPKKYKWSIIKNINYKKETFYMKLLSSNKHEHSQKLVYHLKSPLFAKAMWKEAVDQHVFFRVTCSDSSSAGRTPIGTPQVKKNKEIAKRKRKLSFRLSFGKKRPKTEAEVRAESSRISRPNPTVVRNSSLKRTSSVKSEPSVKSASSSDRASDSSVENEEEKSPESPNLKSILKSHTFPKDSTPDGGDEIDGRPFTNDDFVIEDASESDEDRPNNSLLLTETILEEDEDIESEKRSTSSKKSPLITPTSPSLPLSDLQKKSVVEVIVSSPEEPPKKELPLPTVQIEVCEEPRKLSVDLRKRPNSSEFLPPPLLSQSTREAIIPYYQEEKQATDEPSISKLAKEMLEANYVQEHSKGKIANEDVTPELFEEKTPSEKSKASTDLEPQLNGNGKTDDDEDDRRTIGAASAVAVLGDDEDANMKDLVDDIIGVSGGFLKEQFLTLEVDQDDIESRITESSKSSISNLTDNTEELCNPNILEIIWSKCSTGKDYGYREIFGVKLRKISGRLRQFHSTMLDIENQVSVGTQIPTPPPADDSVSSPPQSSKFSLQSKFVPSWPFDPKSLAVSTELDELDKEAIKAALIAQQELEQDLNKLTSDPIAEDRITTSAAKSKSLVTELKPPDLNVVSPEDSKTPKRDSIPGIPYFCRSVLKSSESSRQSSRRSSHKSTDISNNTLESLVYPPDIQTYQTTFRHAPGLLKYSPENQTSQVKVESKLTFRANPTSNETHTSSKTSISFATNGKLETNKVEDYSSTDHWKPSLISESADSGRSTPSSVSSFPQFVHSVYPLRKMSTNWGSESTVSQQDVASEKIEGSVLTEESSESSTTISNCSIKSVRGSSEESIEEQEEQLEEMFTESEALLGSLSKEISVIEFIHETTPANVQKSSIATEEEQKLHQETTPITAGQSSFVEDCAEEAIQNAKESSSGTSTFEDGFASDVIRLNSKDSFSSVPYQNLDGSSSDSSTESSGSNQSEVNNWADLSIDLSEILPNGEMRSMHKNTANDTSMAEIQDENGNVNSSCKSATSGSTTDEDESDSENEGGESQDEEQKPAGFLYEAPTIVISTERSESDKTNSDDSASTSTNSQDTCEYDFNQSQEVNKEQVEVTSSNRSDTPEGDIKNETKNE